MKIMALVLMLLLSVISATECKVFLFPEETDSAYVRLTPKKPLDLQAFTLCMRIASELKGQREIILFAYHTQQSDELNVWRESDGTISLYLSNSIFGVSFALPPLSVFPTHLCVTWSSTTGATAFWVNGQRSMFKIYGRGHRLNPDGGIILGQDPDSYLGDFDAKQSFVGEITDVHMWDRVLSAGQIKQVSGDHTLSQHGNVLDWNSLQYKIVGNVVELSEA